MTAPGTGPVLVADPKKVHYAHVREALWSPLCTKQMGWVAPLARYLAQVTCERCLSGTSHETASYGSVTGTDASAPSRSSEDATE